MPCCLILLLALLGPRVAIVLMALFTSYFERPFDGLLVPILGFFFLPFTTLGERVVVAANAVVLENSEIPDRVLVAGAPAKVKKALAGRALEWTDFATTEYADMQSRYRAAGIDRLHPSPS